MTADATFVPATEWLIVREIATDEVRLCNVVRGYRPKGPDPVYTWGGPFRSKRAAEKALAARSEELRRQLYPAP